MKKLLSILCTGLLLCGAGLTSCENYDDPVTGNAYGNNSIPEGRTISIAALKEKYNDFIDTSKDTYTTIEGETRIEGVITCDDESGNLYKKLVVADETGAIERVHKTLLQLKKEGKAILLISAELSEVMNLSDRIAVLYEGEMSAQFKAGQYTKEEIGLFMAGKKQEDVANEMDQQ